MCPAATERHSHSLEPQGFRVVARDPAVEVVEAEQLQVPSLILWRR
jgi:hypothetical protein